MSIVEKLKNLPLSVYEKETRKHEPSKPESGGIPEFDDKDDEPPLIEQIKGVVKDVVQGELSRFDRVDDEDENRD